MIQRGSGAIKEVDGTGGQHGAARGLAHERITTTAATLAELVDELGRLPGAGTTDSGLSLAQVLSRCSFLVDGRHADMDTAISAAERVDVLPPFAGG